MPIVKSQGAPPVASWWGTVEIDGTTSTNAVVEAFISNAVVANTTIGAYTSGYYLLDVPCTNGTAVSFKIYGVAANQTGQKCSQGTSTQLNLWTNKTANGVTCTYAGGCTSGYCVDGYCCNEACSGASQDCNVAGHEGTCTSTAATATTAPGGGGGGGGGAATTIKITTTTAVTPITTTIVPSATTSIFATTTTTPGKKPKPGKLEIPGIPAAQVIGITVGVIAIITLVVFILVRFQSIKIRELKPTV